MEEEEDGNKTTTAEGVLSEEGGEEGLTALFTFGMIADVQYADRGDGWNYTRTSQRYYRGALQGLRRAVQAWKATSPPISFILQLGDFLDGFTRDTKEGPQGAWEVLDSTVQEVGCDLHHCLGNHELYCMDREGWRPRFPHVKAQGGETSSSFYYSFSPHPHLVFINLDCYDISIMAPSNEVNAQCATRFMANNPNDDLNSPLNLSGLDKRFVRFNGGVGAQQLQWLDQVLSEATRHSQQVVIFGHIPFHPAVTPPECLLWNYDQVLAILAKHPSTTIATFSGHTHAFACTVDDQGITHYVLDAPLECPPGIDAFSTVYVYEHEIHVKGFGKNNSVRIPFSGSKGEKNAT